MLSVATSASRSFAASQNAEKRANHNAIERARREMLNVRFTELAQSIPSLAHVRKPSKSVIVSRSIEYISEAKERNEVQLRSLKLLRQQNEELKAEINELRRKSGMNPLVFPDIISLDLVYEANLEQKKELENRSDNKMFTPSLTGSLPGGSFTGNVLSGSYDLTTPEEEDEDDMRNGYENMMSPVTIDEVHDFRRHHNGSVSSVHNVLGNSFQGSNQLHHSHSVPNLKTEMRQAPQYQSILSQQLQPSNRFPAHQSHNMNLSPLSNNTFSAPVPNYQQMNMPQQFQEHPQFDSPLRTPQSFQDMPYDGSQFSNQQFTHNRNALGQNHNLAQQMSPPNWSDPRMFTKQTPVQYDETMMSQLMQ
ncbi:hypothetical protein HDV02_004722 [Globomyces sp. JEL0801]|nr:hypothetical protein HDV02_004722 [Globomyces sp. JEL0801]